MNSLSRWAGAILLAALLVGTWSGSGILDDGTTVRLDGLTGWTEESRNRW